MTDEVSPTSKDLGSLDEGPPQTDPRCSTPKTVESEVESIRFVWLFARPLSLTTYFPPLGWVSEGKFHLCHWGVMITKLSDVDIMTIVCSSKGAHKPAGWINVRTSAYSRAPKYRQSHMSVWFAEVEGTLANLYSSIRWTDKIYRRSSSLYR